MISRRGWAGCAGRLGVEPVGWREAKDRSRGRGPSRRETISRFITSGVEESGKNVLFITATPTCRVAGWDKRDQASLGFECSGKVEMR
jgi:hypothetical protein